MPKTIVDLTEHFWSHINKTENCWLWTGSKHSEGYGRIRTRKPPRLVFAHRFSYEINVGKISEGLTIDHLCRNRLCVNPAHLEVVTNKENILRGISPSAKHARKTHCIHGHPFLGKNLRIEKNGSRACRACERTSDHRRRAAI